ncbi:hypothetical protein LUZ60_010817 [Juncus effusus]|nr:hypothetical protein LUZ60_010817 [Juncus effusus]
MDKMLGLLKVKVVRGVNLAYRDTRSSDPYVVLRFGNQKVKTSVKKKDVNPEWNEELTLSVSDATMPVKLEVFDHDTFTEDDSMGDAEFSIQELADVAKMSREGIPSDAVIKTLHPDKDSCIAEESQILIKGGKVCQELILRLKNVHCGEIQLELKWIDVSTVPVC